MPSPEFRTKIFGSGIQCHEGPPTPKDWVYDPKINNYVYRGNDPIILALSPNGHEYPDDTHPSASVPSAPAQSNTPIAEVLQKTLQPV